MSAPKPDALFDVDPAAIVPPEPTEKLSAQRRRTSRQTEALRGGRHPIGLAVGVPLRLHPDAPPPGDKTAAGPRCGGCRFREATGHGKHPFPKCLRGWDGNPRKDPPFASHGAATDCRAWWPACEHWEPKP
ncbi:MAG TPA: hypothetical protein VE465_13865 [Streptosporangiaceae bacterium]|nr:hypothetical protein [Streptosporangiaceae bacterium]